MKIQNNTVVVTGGASGLGLACARRFVTLGAYVVIADLPSSNGEAVARELGANASFHAADVNSESDLGGVFDAAEARGALRAIVHCAGRGGPLRILDKEGKPGDLEFFQRTIEVNLIGSFNVLRLGAARMARNDLEGGERGVFVLTSSIAAYEGQVGQIAYAASKAGIVGMTLVAARDLAQRQIRVCTIAPGIFDTPLLARVPEQARQELGRSVPHPSRLGDPAEFAALAEHIIANQMLNGETIRLDGALRMAAR
jgi:NAD(P)-dependent dehydrogenase (short-subunit alcohol dehydrogenase family)